MTLDCYLRLYLNITITSMTFYKWRSAMNLKFDQQLVGA